MIGLHGRTPGRVPGQIAVRLRVIALGLVISASVACTPLFRDHGYIPPESDLAQLVVGQDTRESVLALVGPPTTAGLLNDQGYYYVQSRFRHFGPLEPQEIEREVLVISFDTGGLVTNIERFGLEQGRVVALSRRVTDDNIADTPFLRQLLGAVGRFDAGQFLSPE